MPALLTQQCRGKTKIAPDNRNSNNHLSRHIQRKPARTVSNQQMRPQTYLRTGMDYPRPAWIEQLQGFQAEWIANDR